MSDFDFSDNSLLCATGSILNSDGSSPLHRQLCDYLFDGVYFVGRDRKIAYWNHGAEELTGYTSEEVLGSHCFDNLLMHVDDKGCELCHGGCPLAATMQDGKRREAEVYLRHKSGHRVPVSVRVAPIKDSSGSIIGAVEVFSDISAKKTIERRARDLEADAYLDQVTGLSNRRHITMAVQHATQEIDEFGTKAGLLIIDIDHFKEVNDRFGHSTGDAVLKTVADTLTHALRPQDRVGRWGGDEFLMLAKGVEVEALEKIGERCRKLIEMSTLLAGADRIRVTASIGGTLLEPGKSPQTAFDRADSLMYISKSQGRNRTLVTVLDSAHDAQFRRRLSSGCRQCRDAQVS
jgi:diguanylate cyclase (GGDEF)-like protein/PAS domain S-box-containing protein